MNRLLWGESYDMESDWKSDALSNLLTAEQNQVAHEVIISVLENRGQLFLLQGSAGTGNTLTVRAIASELR
jgi:chromosomal replication initiation ATPase DnaA